jgi:hypothetical protein
MRNNVPPWALRVAIPEDHSLVQAAQSQDRMQVEWPDLKRLQSWAGHQGWEVPWFGFQQSFIRQMLDNEENFKLAVNESGIRVFVPKQEHIISAEQLRELDALYAERSASGRPTGWGPLVEELREIRRAVEAGVAVQVEGQRVLRTWQAFYGWAHGRYHALEDGYDRWIGDDS